MRTLGLVAGLMLVLTALVPGPVSAQLPGTGSCELVLDQVGSNPSTGNFSSGESRTYTFLIENTGDLRAEAEIRFSQAPAGWSYTPDDRPIALASGESTERSIDVRFMGDVAGDVNLTASLSEPSIECTTGTIDTVTVQGTYDGPETLTLTHAPIADGAGDDFPWAWIVFGAIVAVGLVAVPVAMRARGVRVEATCEEAEKDVIAGRGTSFPITLKNMSKDPVPVQLEVSEVQEGWSALTTLPDLELGPRETRTVYMMVRAPEDAKVGDLCVAKLQVKPDGGSATEVKTLTRVDQAASGADADEGED